MCSFLEISLSFLTVLSDNGPTITVSHDKPVPCRHTHTLIAFILFFILELRRLPSRNCDNL